MQSGSDLKTVFFGNLESCAAQTVYLLAKSFENFLRLILVCATANPVKQAVWMNKKQAERGRGDTSIRVGVIAGGNLHLYPLSPFKRVLRTARSDSMMNTVHFGLIARNFGRKNRPSVSRFIMLPNMNKRFWK